MRLVRPTPRKLLPSHRCMTRWLSGAPDAKLAWKATLLAQLQHAYDSGKWSMDRLLRIQQRQSALPLRASAPPAAADDDAPEQLGVLDDFAIHVTVHAAIATSGGWGEKSGSSASRPASRR